MMGIGINSITLAISIKLSVPRDAEKNEGIKGPIRPPTLAPTAITLNSLPACSLLNKSDMKLQNTEMWKRLKTLTHT